MPSSSKATEDLFPRGHAKGTPFSRKDRQAAAKRGKKRLREPLSSSRGKDVKRPIPKGTDILAVSGNQKVVISDPSAVKKDTVQAPRQPKVKKAEKEVNAPVFFSAIVRKVDLARGITVDVPKKFRPKGQKKVATGFVSLCDVSDDFDKVATILADLTAGKSVQVKIVPTSSDGEKKSKALQRFCLTMRGRDEKPKTVDQLITPADCPLNIGRKIRGFVHSVTKFGAFVEVGRDVRGYVKLSDLSDDYIQNPQESFPTGSLVAGKVCKAEESKKDGELVPFSLRTKKRVVKPVKAPLEEEGQLTSGIVERVERFGAIIKLDSGRKALLHVSEAHDLQMVEKPDEEWTIGQKLSVVVVEVKEKRFKVGTKRSYFEAAGVDAEQINTLLEHNASGEPVEPAAKKMRLDEDAEMTDEESGAEDEDIDDEVEVKVDVEDSEDEEDVESSGRDEPKKKDTSASKQLSKQKVEPAFSDQDDECGDDVAALAINHSFSGNGTGTRANTEEEDGNENDDAEGDVAEKNGDDDKKTEEEEPTLRKRKSAKEKKEKKRAKEAAEREIRMKEEALASNENGPQSAEDFERMLLAEPNSSAIWIRYMAFRLGLVQVDKARAIAERALDTIELEKELERVNLWMAYINLEANFSTAGDVNPAMKAAAIFRVFDRAVKRVTDQLDFHLQVFGSLRESEPKIAEEVMKRAIKNFRSSKEVWITAGQAKFESNEAPAARKLLERALLAVEKRDYVAVIMKFSQFEYKHGSVEKGRTVFESLIGNYPKRLDVWNVFLDMETGVCRGFERDSEEFDEAVGATRLVFERCSCLELSSKKMKSIFKKWLSFEKSFGNKESHRDVLLRAKEYVESKTNSLPAAE